jgi:AraC-like DNA-binding protein
LPSGTDIRLQKIISYIDVNIGNKISLKELAFLFPLSVSRLQHIFKEDVGISIKKYLLWRKLILGLEIILMGRDFTHAAHQAGFSDSSHMSRTFKKSFGINLSELFHKNRSVQVTIGNSLYTNPKSKTM